MSSATNVSLTIKLQPTQSVVPFEPYLYRDAVGEALGDEYTRYSGSPSPADNTLFLWEAGCRTNETWDCALACTDPKKGPEMVWNSLHSMFTLQNCLVYPVLATAASQGWLVQEPPGILEKFGITAKQSLPTGREFDGDHSEVGWPVIRRCEKAPCARLRGYTHDILEKCSLEEAMIETEHEVGPSDDPWRPSLVFGLCNIGIYAANADLGGPGILVSGLQQIAIAMFIWLTLSSLQWLRCAVSIYQQRRPYTVAPSRLASLLTPGKQIDALIVGLIQFQKTQVFFLLALQAVSLLALYDATWLDAPTPFQIEMNLLFLTMISAAGVYPVVLGLVTLRTSKGLLDWFTLVASLSCVAVSSLTGYKATHTPMSAAQVKQDGYSLEECGGINPSQYCIRPGPIVGSESPYVVSPQWISVGPVCALLYLIVERAMPGEARTRLGRLPSWIKKFLPAFCLACAQAWLLWGNIQMFITIYAAWSAQTYDGRVWTIGQVLSVGMWIPVGLEYLYLALRGIEQSFSLRLPVNYKVVKTDAGGGTSSPVVTTRGNPPSDGDQQNNATRSSYELLPPSSSSIHRVAHAHTWLPA